MEAETAFPGATSGSATDVPQLQPEGGAPAIWAPLFLFTQKRHVPVIIMALAAAMFVAAMRTVQSVILGLIFDIISEFGDGLRTGDSALSQVSTWCLVLAGLAIGSWLANTVFLSLWIIYGELQACQARKEVQTRLLAKKVEWFDLLSDGVEGLHARVYTHIRDLQTAASQTMGFVICDVMVSCGSLVISFLYSWKLTLVLLSTLPISFFVLGITSRSLDSHLWSQKQFLQKASTLAAAAVNGIDLVRIFTGFRQEREKYGHALNLASIHFLAQARRNAIQMGYVAFWSIAIFVLGFGYGTTLVRQGLPPGHVVTTCYSLLTALRGIESIARNWLVLAKGKSAARFLKCLLTEHMDDEKVCAPWPAIDGEEDMFVRQNADIELTKVHFAYCAKPDVRVLKEATIRFPGQQISFLVGESGSGKSTVCALIAGLLLPSDGEMKMLGHRFRRARPGCLGQHVTLVHQNSPVIHDSLFNNVALGRGSTLGTSMTEVQRACEFAHLQSTILGFQSGLDTMMHPESRQLSGGQRQRLALARAWLRDSPVLILDEPTSAMDPLSQAAMMKSIRQWRRNKTTIIVTHDLSNIEENDFVCVMANGSVRCQGTMKDLDTRVVSGALPNMPDWDSSSSELKSHRRQSSTHRMCHEYDYPRPSSAWDHEHRKTMVSAVTRPTTQRDSISGPPGSKRNSTNACWGLKQDPEDKQRQFSLYLNRQFRISRVPPSLESPQQHMDSCDSPAPPRDVLHVDLHEAEKRPPRIVVDQDAVTAQTSEKHQSPTILEQFAVVSPKEMRQSIRPILASIWPSLNHRDRFHLICAFVLCVVAAAATPAFAYCFAQLLNAMRPSHDGADETLKWSCSLLGIAVVDGLCTGNGHYLFDKVGQAWVDSLRKDAFENVLEQPDSWFREAANDAKRLVSCLDRNGQEMRIILGQFVPIATVVAALALISVIWATIISWKLALVTLSPLPLVVCIIKLYSHVSSRWESECNDVAANSSSILREVLLNFEFVRVFNTNAYFTSRQDRSARRCLQTGLKRAVFTAPLFGLYQCMNLPLVALVFYYGTTILSRDPATSVSHILQVINLLLFSVGISFDLLTGLPQIAAAKAAATELLAFVALPRVTPTTRHSLILPPSPLPIRMVNTHYTPRQHSPVLRAITLSIQPGSRIALVGPSGSGKSTLLSLLLGLNAPDFPLQSLSFGGISHPNIDMRSLRTAMAFVPQKPFLFPSSISNNITYGSSSSSDPAAAATAAGAHAFISSLPESYNTLVGDGGQALSGGQSQRINIARALHRNPRLLILDEPTSALDGESAAAVARTLTELAASHVDLAMIVATHSPEMMKIMDEVVVLDAGRVVERGPYNDVLAQRGYLFRLVNSEQ